VLNDHRTGLIKLFKFFSQKYLTQIWAVRNTTPLVFVVVEYFHSIFREYLSRKIGATKEQISKGTQENEKSRIR
jgi:hypothetical protein